MPDTELDDFEAAAAEAGLRHVTDELPGYRRLRAGRGFSYRAPDGSLVTEPRLRKRFASLAIPPAWTDVWICTDPRGHLQATGRDDRGRKQYRYHDRWHEARALDKFGRLGDFGESLPDLRADVRRSLTRRHLDDEVVRALVVRLLDQALVRVGNPEYADDNETYGLTTLERSHVTLTTSRARFEFVGKSGVEHVVDVGERRLVTLIRRCHGLGGERLFCVPCAADGPRAVTSSDINEYLTQWTSATAKTFRTWGGTVLALEALATEEPADRESERERQIVAAVDRAAEALRNTRAVCRTGYVHPAIPEAFADGELRRVWARTRPGAHLTRAERATLRILASRS